VLGGDLVQSLLRYGQHSGGSAGDVINKVGAVLDLVGDWQKDKVGHELHDIARRGVFSGFFIVLFIEPPDQFFEDRAHGVIVQPGHREARRPRYPK
jgi:hypothetical protein